MFREFQKIPRLNREVVVTEKIDGTNAQILIAKRRDIPEEYHEYNLTGQQVIDGTDTFILAGSRNRYIKPGDDNFGFAAWVSANWEELLSLGEGRHFGEWWGRGIQRGYGIEERRFSLFNTGRWGYGFEKHSPPSCCGVVPVIYRGLFSSEVIDTCIKKLRKYGSVAEVGFMNPEGLIVYHTAASSYFKVTLEGDDQPKSTRVGSHD